MDKWFENRWQEFLKMSVKDFIKEMKSGNITTDEKGRFLLKLINEVSIKPECLVTTSLKFKENT